ncbi:MAG TPA: flavohemoglobin expression-modulating QEGLA motif protein [Polyangiaceae bacterium]|nr:flavohemoglobin expression-modulating QEGLA motif protein [Polyangiaceae bacterium]
MAERRAREADEPAPERDEKRRPDAGAEAAPEPSAAGKNGARANGANGKEVRDDVPQAVVPSIPPPPVTGPWRSYKEIVAQLAGRIVEAQRPIRVLQALRWEESIEEQFFKGRLRELPKVDAGYYERVELGFDPRGKAEEFEQIARDIDREVGERDAVGQIMMTTALEYRDVVSMLAARGTPAFYAWSRKLYGSPKDMFPDGRSSVRDLGQLLYGILTNVDEWSGAMRMSSPIYARTIDAADAARQLDERLADYFGDVRVRVEADDVILADAAAGSDYVKVRRGARFSARDIDILEVHEGWVHVATSLNGQAQPVAKWLAKGPPRTTAVQEGLAALLEMFTFRTYPRRARRLNDRVLAVDKAEDGASFLEVFDWFRTEGYDEEECFHNTRRIFRGGVVEGGAPFTKDACYCKGVVLNYAFVRSAIQHDRVDLVPFLFVGKVAHEDVPVLARRVADGVVRPPKYLPPMFRDLNGLAIWMAYSTFFSQLGGEAITEHYARVFDRV